MSALGNDLSSAMALVQNAITQFKDKPFDHYVMDKERYSRIRPYPVLDSTEEAICKLSISILPKMQYLIGELAPKFSAFWGAEISPLDQYCTLEIEKLEGDSPYFPPDTKKNLLVPRAVIKNLKEGQSIKIKMLGAIYELKATQKHQLNSLCKEPFEENFYHGALAINPITAYPVALQPLAKAVDIISEGYNAHMKGIGAVTSASDDALTRELHYLNTFSSRALTWSIIDHYIQSAIPDEKDVTSLSDSQS